VQAEKVSLDYSIESSCFVWHENLTGSHYKDQLASLFKDVKASSAKKVLVVSNEKSFLLRSLSALFWFKNNFLAKCKSNNKIKVGWVVQNNPLNFFIVKSYLAQDSVSIYKSMVDAKKYF
jgi:hypothetical protein